ncbi:MAG TPA: VCBS repeat-containing protein, partial [Methylomirabilota bacterium]|nr:VCBS repeat-containing protein [Methylomirabilota bacterium]
MNRSATILLGLAGASLGVPALRAAPPLLDAPWRAFDTGDFPTFAPVAISAGDLDGDGVPDVVAAREFFSGPGLSVLFGAPDGTFGPEVLYTLPFNQDLGDVGLLDVDIDGDLDAVASVSGNAGMESRVVLYRNSGGGSFAAPQYFPAGPGPVGIAVEDFTG